MIFAVLVVYAAETSVDVGFFAVKDLCWEAAHRLQSVEINADCRMRSLDFAMETSPFPKAKPPQH